MNNNIPIGDRIKLLRKKKKKTQKEVCNAIHIEQVTMSQYENNKRIPKLDILISIADYYSVSLDYLVGRIDTFTNISDSQTHVVHSFSDNAVMLLENFEKLEKEEQVLILGKTIELAREQQKTIGTTASLKKVQ